jgi:hypothetical protein
VSIEGYKDASLRIDVREAPAERVVVLVGALGQFEPGAFLAPFLERLDAGMAAGGCTRATIDLRALRFMNSASFKPFVTWLKRNDAAPPERQYRIHFLLSGAHHWQEVSIHALAHFSKLISWESE